MDKTEVPEAEGKAPAEVLERIEAQFVCDRKKLSSWQKVIWSQFGNQRIVNGKIAVVILAGGQGTRLGFDRPKGEYEIGLPSKKSIFQILTERFVKAQMLAHKAKELTDDCQKCKLLIMTSRINHDQTVEFFTKNNYFGAKKENIIFFEQAVLPVISSSDGKILLEDRHRLNLGPNGNGALFDSVANNETVKDIIQQSEFVQIIGVDNVLNKILDPIFIGFAISKNLQAVMKSCVKRDAKEPVGVVVKRKNMETGLSKYDIIEYSEISKEDVEAIDPASGELKFNLGNILVFLISSRKLLELVNNASTLNALYHKAFKKYTYLDPVTGEKQIPTAPNAYKFELFIHNFLPMCDQGRFGVFRVPREEEFAPVKNAEGVDSPQSARDLIYAQSIRWLLKAGAIVSEDQKVLEIDTMLSYQGEGLEQFENQTISQNYLAATPI